MEFCKEFEGRLHEVHVKDEPRVSEPGISYPKRSGIVKENKQ